MSAHVDFREGRRVRAADLNAESDAHDTEAERHQELAHPADRLAGTEVRHPTGAPSVTQIPGGPAAGVRVALGTGPPELEIGVAGGHHATGSVTAGRAAVTVAGALRLGLRAPGPPAPAPWSIRSMEVNGDDGRPVARELRVELSSPPGSPPSESRVSVGILDPLPAGGARFRALLTVDAAGDVALDGAMEVAGSVSQGEIQPDPEDPRFVELLADVLARRVIGVATSAPDQVMRLTAAVTQTAASTTLDVTIKPSTAITRWGVALERRRDGTSRFAMVKVGGPTNQNSPVAITVPTISWDPPLDPASPGRLLLAVAGFDTQGSLHAQRFDSGDLTG
jgi:hypothetical protein